MHLPLGDILAGSLEDRLIALEAVAEAIASADPVEEADRYGGRTLGRASVRAHVATQRLLGKRMDWLAAEQASGLWSTDGRVRTYIGYVARAHGISHAHAAREVRAANALEAALPATRQGFRDGRIGWDQVLVLVAATTTPARVDALQFPCRPEPDVEDIGPDAGSGPDGDGIEAPNGGADGDGGNGASGDTADGASGDTADGAGGDTADGAAGQLGAHGSSETGDDPGGLRAAATACPTVEEVLLAHARTMSPEDLRRVVRHFAQTADPEADDRGYRHAQEREHLSLDRTFGGFHMSGFVTDEHGQLIRTALDAVIGVPPAGDPRTAGQRRAQGLADMAQLVLDQGLAGNSHSVRPHLGVLIGPEQFGHVLKTASLRQDGPSPAAGEVAPFTRADLTDASWDVLSRLDWEALLDAPPATWTDGTGPVPAAVLRRLAGCDGDVYRTLFSPASEVINHGRAHRVFTAAQMRALVARDRHCTFPGCTAPPSICQAHHARVHWSDGGPTDLSNGALLCYHHHTWVDTRKIAMTRRDGAWAFHGPDGTEIIPPITPWKRRE